MNDPLLMRVLHRLASGDEEFEPIWPRKVCLMAVVRNQQDTVSVSDGESG
jgi:hypothetical protein